MGVYIGYQHSAEAHNEGEKVMIDFATNKATAIAAMEAVADHFKSIGCFVGFGASEKSCSSYIEVGFEDVDEDSPTWGANCLVKLRFSDHADRYGSDYTMRVDHISDEGDFADAIAAAISFAIEFAALEMAA